MQNFTDISSSKTKEFIRECTIAQNFNHPNVMSLIGVSLVPDETILLMVLPYMYHGDVKSFLKSKREGKIEFTEFPEVKNNTELLCALVKMFFVCVCVCVCVCIRISVTINLFKSVWILLKECSIFHQCTLYIGI